MKRAKAERGIKRAPLAALLAAGLVCGPPAGPAAAGDLTLACPASPGGEPTLVDGAGRSRPITDPAARAIAARACDSDRAGGAAVGAQVTNRGASTVYVAFTNYATQKPGPIVWEAKCAGQVANSQLALAPGASCAATIPVSAGLTRFCAARAPVPVGQVPNCNLAQSRNQTMIETNFGSGANGVCYPAGLASCVWYDVSVIPQNCTPDAWAQNRCANAGGASYNLPVSLACGGQPSFSCKGPRSGAYGAANYPSNCGDPAARCVGGAPGCDNAYFFPTPQPQPNAQCPAGQTLRIDFLAGP